MDKTLLLEYTDCHNYNHATKLATSASKKTKELGQSVNEKVKESKIYDNMSDSVSSLASKVKEGTLLNDVGTSMSGLASKFTSVSTKGWKDLSSLWGEPKTTLASADTSPGEKTSLLNLKTDGSDDPSKSGLLADDEDSWGGWAAESWGDQSQKKKEDDDLEAWLNDDNASADSAPKSKTVKKEKSNTSEGWDDWSGGGGENDDWGSWDSGSNNKSTFSSNNKKSSKEKQSVNSSKSKKDMSLDNGFGSVEPALGNLVDLGGGSSEPSGWDNEVWADEEDEWQSLDVNSSEKSKKATAGRFRKGD